MDWRTKRRVYRRSRMICESCKEKYAIGYCPDIGWVCLDCCMECSGCDDPALG